MQALGSQQIFIEAMEGCSSSFSVVSAGLAECPKRPQFKCAENEYSEYFWY